MTVRNIASICNMVSADGGGRHGSPCGGRLGGLPRERSPARGSVPYPGGGGAGQAAPGSGGDGVGRRRVTMSRGVFLEQPGRGPGRDGDAGLVRGPPGAGLTPAEARCRRSRGPPFPPPALPPALIILRKDQSWVLNPH